ncbi:MAG: carboxymuconolactone decarboxylase family protein [Actinomycetota bacterium]|nr:carboxymuconolactone decarboxylase family protein [Actinomycetota bacterium]MDP2288034.1 carboxymuconolactone decarboxylase family protein [Actinomycetota bacterium]
MTPSTKSKGLTVQRLPEAEVPAEMKNPNRIVLAGYNNPEMFKGFASLSGRVHSASRLSDRVREILVLRTLYRVGSSYQCTLHEPVALKAGVTTDELEALKVADFEVFSAAEIAALNFCEAADGVDTTDELWAKTVAHWSPQEISDMVMLAGFYAMAGRYLLAMGIVAE